VEVLHKLPEDLETIRITVGYKGPKVAEQVIDLGAYCVYNRGGKGNSWPVHDTPIKHLDHPVLVPPCDIVELYLEPIGARAFAVLQSCVHGSKRQVIYYSLKYFQRRFAADTFHQLYSINEIADRSRVVAA